MPLEDFHRFYPKVAEDETRYLTLERPGPGSRIPPGSYALVEFYCTEQGCDCRRVILRVLERTRGPVATISYGFDRDQPMAGPFLDPMNTQSPYAQELLELIDEMTLHDQEYLARLERHYGMVKEAIRNCRRQAKSGKKQRGPRKRKKRD